MEGPPPRFWDSLASDGDTLFFASWNDDEPPAADLLFVPTGTPRLRSATLEVTYELGRDFTWEPGSRHITLPATTRIPFRRCAELYPPRGAQNAIAESRIGPTHLLWSEGLFFHDAQVVATYTPVEIEPGFEPLPSRSTNLPRSLARLRAGEPLHLVVLGDSISEGYNASAFVDAKPHQEAYPGRVANQLRTRYRSEITLTNLALAGTTSACGKEMAEKAAAALPDLVIIAFGMNDAGGTSPASYSDNIRAILDTIRATRPDCEFILVASMLGNPEFAPLHPELFPAYRDELVRLVGPGVALADLTTLWERLLSRKHYLDLSGNGVNHPNDFGHRLYANVILQSFAAGDAESAALQQRAR